MILSIRQSHGSGSELPVLLLTAGTLPPVGMHAPTAVQQTSIFPFMRRFVSCPIIAKRLPLPSSHDLLTDASFSTFLLTNFTNKSWLLMRQRDPPSSAHRSNENPRSSPCNFAAIRNCSFTVCWIPYRRRPIEHGSFIPHGRPSPTTRRHRVCRLIRCGRTCSTGYRRASTLVGGEDSSFLPVCGSPLAPFRYRG